MRVKILRRCYADAATAQRALRRAKSALRGVRVAGAAMRAGVIARLRAPAIYCVLYCC